MLSIMKKVPNNVEAAEFHFYRYGVLFVATEGQGVKAICSAFNTMYRADGSVVYDDHGCDFYVFSDLDTVLFVNHDTFDICRVKELPVAIHDVRRQMLEKLYRFFTTARVHSSDDINGEECVWVCSDNHRSDNLNGALIDRYFKDGKFKSNGAMVRFFCAFMSEVM